MQETNPYNHQIALFYFAKANPFIISIINRFVLLKRILSFVDNQMTEIVACCIFLLILSNASKCKNSLYLIGTIADESNAKRIINIKGYMGTLNKFDLYQNSPNPFNPSTIISYQLPVTGYIGLKRYDILGRETKTLVDRLQKAGMHTMHFDAKVY